MKTTKAISFILKVIGYALGICGGLLVIGSPGALDQGSISILQFIGQEFLGIVLMGAAFIVYIIREIFKEEYLKVR